MSIQTGIPFISQLFLIDDDAQPIPQSAPFPKISGRYVTGAPSDIFVNQTMTPDAPGTFLFQWTPAAAGQYRLKYEYVIDGNSCFFFDDIDAEVGGGSGGSSENADMTIIAESDADEIIVDDTSSVTVTDSNMEAIVIVEEC